MIYHECIRNGEEPPKDDAFEDGELMDDEEEELDNEDSFNNNEVFEVYEGDFVDQKDLNAKNKKK